MTTGRQAALQPGQPEAGDTEVTPTKALPAAGLGIRVVARLIDMVVLIWALQSVAIEVFWVLAAFLASRTMTYETAVQKVSQTSLLNYVVGILAAAVFYAVCEGLYGATPGKMICGLAVLLEDGSHCGLAEAFGRALVYPIDVVIGIWRMESDPLHQRLGDKWLHTVVVKRRELSPAWDRSGALFVFALLLACPL